MYSGKKQPHGITKRTHLRGHDVKENKGQQEALKGEARWVFCAVKVALTSLALNSSRLLKLTYGSKTQDMYVQTTYTCG